MGVTDNRVAIDGTGIDSTQLREGRIGDRRTGSVLLCEVDEVAADARRCPRHTVWVVAGETGNAAVHHMFGMFVRCAGPESGRRAGDIAVRVAAETEVVTARETPRGKGRRVGRG